MGDINTSNNENDNYKEDIVVVAFDGKDNCIINGKIDCNIDEADCHDPMLAKKVSKIYVSILTEIEYLCYCLFVSRLA